MYNDELYHWGVLGMKWGIRRYQPYSTTGPRKGGKTGKEIGEAAERKAARKEARVQRKEERKKVKEARKVEKVERKAQKREEAKRRVEEAKQKRTEQRKALIAKDPKLLYRFRDEFSDKEIESALKRYDLEKKLREASIDKIETGRKYIDMIGRHTNSIANIYKNVNAIEMNKELMSSRRENQRQKELEKRKNHPINKLDDSTITKIKESKSDSSSEPKQPSIAAKTDSLNDMIANLRKRNAVPSGYQSSNSIKKRREYLEKLAKSHK